MNSLETYFWALLAYGTFSLFAKYLYQWYFQDSPAPDLPEEEPGKSVGE